jgi:S-(hydroxymethyl)glutathione dehydrogenase / alcohol dehydrogenase
VRAAVYTAVGSPLEVLDLEPSPLGSHEVLVDSRAGGLCHSDLQLLEAPEPRYALPIIMGHEGAGVVAAVGPEVESLKAGDRVICAWVPSCGNCYWCVRGQASICQNFTTREGRRRFRTADGREAISQSGLGTMAEQMIGHELAFLKVETDLPDEYLALIGCGVTTGACAAMRAAPVRPGDSAAVFGCGGVGISAIQGARVAGGVPIIAVDPVALKRETALRLGATHAVDPNAVDPVAAVRELTGGRGADVAFETAGRDNTATWAVESARRGGTAVCVGVGHPDISSLNIGNPKTVKWSLYGDADPRRDFPVLLSMAEQGLLDLDSMVSRRLKLDEVNSGFEAMERGEVIRSVIVF